MSFLLIFELAFVSVSIHRLPFKMRGRISVAHFFFEPGYARLSAHIPASKLESHTLSVIVHWRWWKRISLREIKKEQKNRTEEWKLDVYNKFFFITPIEITKYCLSEIHSVNRERASEWYSVYHKNWNIENMRDMKTV